MTFCNLNPVLCQVAPYSNNSFLNAQLPKKELTICSSGHLQEMSHEIFRMVWIMGEFISLYSKDCIASCFQNNTWQEHPYFGGLQTAYNQMSRKVTQIGQCTASKVSSAIEKSWRAFNAFLRKEETPQGLRSELLLDSNLLGPFSNTPLIISSKKSDLPNVISPKQFERLFKVYKSIENGTSQIQIEGSLSFKTQILSDIKIICSTRIGRELIYALHKSAIKCLITESKGTEPESYAYSSRTNPIGGISISLSPNSTGLYFGSIDKSIDIRKPMTFSTLFHEAAHHLKHIKLTLKRMELIAKKQKINQECENLQHHYTFLNESLKEQTLQKCENEQLEIALACKQIGCIYAEQPKFFDLLQDILDQFLKLDLLQEILNEYLKLERVIDRLNNYLFNIFTNSEEIRVINLTNILRQELFMSGGDPSWKGRCSHIVYKGANPESARIQAQMVNSLFETLQSIRLPPPVGTILRTAAQYGSLRSYLSRENEFNLLIDHFLRELLNQRTSLVYPNREETVKLIAKHKNNNRISLARLIFFTLFNSFIEAPPSITTAIGQNILFSAIYLTIYQKFIRK